MLEELGQNIVVAQSGEEALKRLLEHEFAVILLDVNMPGMDGLETAAYIRKRQRTAHTPIIFVTAYADEMHTAQAIRWARSTTFSRRWCPTFCAPRSRCSSSCIG